MSDSVFSNTHKIGVHAESSVGKTLQIASLIDLVGLDKVKILSADEGLSTIRSRIKEENVIKVKKYEDVRTIYKELVDWAKPDRWLCIDGGTQILKWNANKQFVGADMYFEKKTKHEEITDAIKPYGRYMSKEGFIDSQRVYNRIGTDTEYLFSTWKALDCNIYANFLTEMVGGDGFRKMPPWHPDAPGKMGRDAIVSAFDYIIYMAYDENGKRTGYFNPTKSLQYKSKTRDDRNWVKLPKSMQMPETPDGPEFNLADFIKIISARPSATAEAQPEPTKEVVDGRQQSGSSRTESSTESDRRAAKADRGARSDAGVPQGRGV